MFLSIDLSHLSDLYTMSAGYLSLFFGFALLGFAGSCSCGSCGGSDGEDADADDDSAYAELEGQIEELKSKLEGGETEARRELADACLAFAVQLQQDDFLEESVEAYDEALGQFQILKDENADDEDIVRLLGLANLSRAVALNDLGEKEEAITGYDRAVEIFLPIAARGDGEAKYDVAGIKLNRGIIYHELGELDKANKELDEAFTDFRALEKISELDTRFYMAKVSVAIGNLFRDLEEPIEKIVDVYNRAMRLFVELIDAGDMKYESDLANVLIDKCLARYDAGEGEAVLLDMQRGLEILEKIARENPGEGQFDLFNALMAYGVVLLDLEKYGDALSIFNDVAAKFPEFKNADDPILLNEYAGMFDHRGMCSFALQKIDEAIADLTQAIDIRESFWEEEWDLDDDDLSHLAPSLVSSYCNRALVYEISGKKDLSLDDCQKAMNVLEPYADDLGDDYEELCEQIKEIQSK